MLSRCWWIWTKLQVCEALHCHHGAWFWEKRQKRWSASHDDDAGPHADYNDDDDEDDGDDDDDDGDDDDDVEAGHHKWEDRS